MLDKQKILVVDDDDSTRKLIGLSLAATDYEIIEASSGVDALQILENSTVDGIVTDYRMPTMNGVELVRFLRSDQRWRKLPVVMVSCCFTSESITEATNAGVARCLAKPFRRQHLQDVVRRIVPQNCQN
jgi:two-component system chemotaxis response regulator CheY